MNEHLTKIYQQWLANMYAWAQKKYNQATTISAQRHWAQRMITYQNKFLQITPMPSL